MVQKGSRVAAIYDVHDNLPALQAVLADLESLNPGDYELDRAVERIRATGYPEAEEMAQILLDPPDPEWVATFFEQQAARD